ncbi:Panacea domain-containing protein, partial [Helicobacter bilis]|uniref:Panacea domain-containing protein n=1 Tax=Helicobacter bilis TaxID=37372 RepID=UPI0025A9A462
YKDNTIECLQVLGNIHENPTLLNGEKMKAKVLAQYIINRSNKGISNIELQKILYFVVLKHYKDIGEYLLDENFEAWQFGAIIYSVYRDYRSYGANSIDKTNENIEIEDSIKQRVDFVLSKLSNYNYWDWVGMLHAKGGAWDITYSKEKKGVIPCELIKKESFIINQICNGICMIQKNSLNIRKMQGF